MEFIISRAKLLAALQAATGVVERRHSYPILANVLLRATPQGLSVIGSDMEMELTSRVEIDSLITPGEITVGGKKLLDICRSLPEVPVILKLQNSKLLLQAGRSRFQLMTLPAEEFPVMSAEQEMSQVTLVESELMETLSAIHFAMAQQDVRYYLNGMLFEFSANNFTAVATDGHRLALRRLALTTEEDRQTQFIVPRKAILELIRLLKKDSEQSVQLRYSSNNFCLSLADLTIVSRLIDGRFPDYHRVIPEMGDKTIVVDRDEFRQLLLRVAVLSNEKYHGVRLNFQPGVISVMANNMEQEEAQDELMAEYMGPAIEIGFNVNYLLDVLNVLPGGKVKIILSTPEASVLLESEGENNSCYVIMPLCI